jgi:hypothetical protein
MVPEFRKETIESFQGTADVLVMAIPMKKAYFFDTRLPDVDFPRMAIEDIAPVRPQYPLHAPMEKPRRPKSKISPSPPRNGLSPKYEIAHGQFKNAIGERPLPAGVDAQTVRLAVALVDGETVMAGIIAVSQFPHGLDHAIGDREAWRPVAPDCLPCQIFENGLAPKEVFTQFPSGKTKAQLVAPSVRRYLVPSLVDLGHETTASLGNPA